MQYFGQKSGFVCLFLTKYLLDVLTSFRLSWFPLFFLIIQPQGLSCGFFVIQLGISLTLFCSWFWSPPNANVTSAFKNEKILQGFVNLSKTFFFLIFTQSGIYLLVTRTILTKYAKQLLRGTQRFKLLQAEVA